MSNVALLKRQLSTGVRPDPGEILAAIRTPGTTPAELSELKQALAPYLGQNDFMVVQLNLDAMIQMAQQPAASAPSTRAPSRLQFATSPNDSTFSQALREAVARFASQDIRFASAPGQFAVPTDQWTKHTGGFGATSKSAPAVAIRSLFESSPPPNSRFALECLTATAAVMYEALRRHVGDRVFNQMETINLSDSYIQSIRRLPNVTVTHIGDQNEEASETFKANLRPGDAVFFKNWDASSEAKSRGWGGENALFLGKSDTGERLYFAHPFGLTTESQIVQRLNQERSPGSNRSASLSTILARIEMK